jgi:hypothetical protein
MSKGRSSLEGAISRFLRISSAPTAMRAKAGEVGVVSVLCIRAREDRAKGSARLQAVHPEPSIEWTWLPRQVEYGRVRPHATPAPHRYRDQGHHPSGSLWFFATTPLTSTGIAGADRRRYGCFRLGSSIAGEAKVPRCRKRSVQQIGVILSKPGFPR